MLQRTLPPSVHLPYERSALCIALELKTILTLQERSDICRMHTGADS